MRLLFVCTGNTCRSVLAHQYAVKLAADLKLDLEVASAGLAADKDIPQPPAVAMLLAKEGVKDYKHVPAPLTPEAAAGADLILAMTAAQKDAVTRQYPAAAAKTHTLVEYAGFGRDDVPDPFGRDDLFYFSVFKTIKAAVAAVLEKIKNR